MRLLAGAFADGTAKAVSRTGAGCAAAAAGEGAGTTAPPPIHPEIEATDPREGAYHNHNTTEVQAIRTDLGTRCTTVRTHGARMRVGEMANAIAAAAPCASAAVPKGDKEPARSSLAGS